MRKFRRGLCDRMDARGCCTKYVTIPKKVWEFIWPSDSKFVDIVVDDESGILKMIPVAEGE
ncbi:MAG: hypothetical protein MUO26_11430 [Methanotrichaceae archaeon]|nr:hypothetical protein [Methanotrichaceae archaeon]